MTPGSGEATHPPAKRGTPVRIWPRCPEFGGFGCVGRQLVLKTSGTERLMVRLHNPPPICRCGLRASHIPSDCIIGGSMKSTEAAWLAGYIDGDGCISITHKGRKWRTPIIAIDSADKELLDRVAGLLGGTVILKPKTRTLHRQVYTWRLYGTEKVIAALTELSPFLQCKFKKDRANMIIREWRSCTPRNGRYTPEVTVLKANFEKRFLALGEGRGSRTRLVA